ncbi:hypothetical protein DHEL01_v208998 [Diaporthe helianthi]|uniref:Uncharacterized protein n=1 Tax=Diaporthe helianthi TaxID=158607 RepID=A0A2P5HQT6_DIAHE|nr:hypothetical protein DHEL01_v208998 [Diaporthe helianthi]
MAVEMEPFPRKSHRPPAEASNLSDWSKTHIGTPMRPQRVWQRTHSAIDRSIDLSERVCLTASAIATCCRPRLAQQLNSVEHLMEASPSHNPMATLTAGFGAGYVQRKKKWSGLFGHLQDWTGIAVVQFPET